MLCSNLHEDMENPSDIPAFSGSVPKKPRKESVTDVLAGTALAFANEKTNQASGSMSVSQPPVTGGASPGKAIKLRMKNFEQLCYLQQLCDDGILNPKEFAEQSKTFCHLCRNSMYISLIPRLWPVAFLYITVSLHGNQVHDNCLVLWP